MSVGLEDLGFDMASVCKQLLPKPATGFPLPFCNELPPMLAGILKLNAADKQNKHVSNQRTSSSCLVTKKRA